MIQWWQILLLTLYSAYQICDELTIVSSAGSLYLLVSLLV
ncbi:PTS system transporter subunit IIC [Streptococcus pneumoniae]|nr:PTS system transporter subunit IIC [Streptococcus pneumoniae]